MSDVTYSGMSSSQANYLTNTLKRKDLLQKKLDRAMCALYDVSFVNSGLHITDETAKEAIQLAIKAIKDVEGME